MRTRFAFLIVASLGLVLGLAPTAHAAMPPPEFWTPRNPYAFVNPIDGGRVISHYGPRGGRPHQGIDIKRAPRTPIWAAYDGVVVQSGSGMSGYGISVTIDHGEGVVTRYAHLAGTPVRAGQWVKQGTHIGSEGRTGRATTHHLHYEVIIDGRHRDPRPFLRS